jgi:hypothetical protein
MAMCSACGSASAVLVCRPEEDPFLLLESMLRAVEEILSRRRWLPLRRTWIEQPYGEEEITRLEEEVIPAIQLGFAVPRRTANDQAREMAVGHLLQQVDQEFREPVELERGEGAADEVAEQQALAGS